MVSSLPHQNFMSEASPLVQSSTSSDMRRPGPSPPMTGSFALASVPVSGPVTAPTKAPPLSSAPIEASQLQTPVPQISSATKGKGLLEVPTTKISSQIPALKPTWCDLVQGNNKKMVRKGESFVLDSGEICVKISNDVIKRNLHKWDDFIIAQFQGNTPSPGALHAITNGIWSNKLRNITVSRLTERAFLIKIPCPATRKRVLAQGLWHIEKQAMFVAKWKPGFQPEVPELTSAPVWVDFKNVPPHFYSEE